MTSSGMEEAGRSGASGFFARRGPSGAAFSSLLTPDLKVLICLSLSIKSCLSESSFKFANLADRNELWGGVQSERLLQVERSGGNKEARLDKSRLVTQGYLPSRSPCSSGTSWWSGLGLHVWENRNPKAGQFGDVGLRIGDSIRGLLSCFF